MDTAADSDKKEFLQRDYNKAPESPTGLKGNAAGVKSYNNRSGRCYDDGERGLDWV